MRTPQSRSDTSPRREMTAWVTGRFNTVRAPRWKSGAANAASAWHSLLRSLRSQQQLYARRAVSRQWAGRTLCISVGPATWPPSAGGALAAHLPAALAPCLGIERAKAGHHAPMAAGRDVEQQAGEPRLLDQRSGLAEREPA